MGTDKQDPPSVTRKHRKLIAENRMFELYFDHVIAGDRTEVPEYLIVVPKQRTLTDQQCPRDCRFYWGISTRCRPAPQLADLLF